MKMNLTSRALSVLLVFLLLTAISSRAQTMVLKIQDGIVTVNEQVFAKNDLPADLDIEGVELSISFFDGPSINVELNGNYYEVTERAIESIERPDKVQVRIRNRSGKDDGSWSYEITGGYPHTLSNGHVISGETFLEVAAELWDLHGSQIAEELKQATSALDLVNVTIKPVQGESSSADNVELILIPHLQRMAEVMNYFSQMQDADHELYEEVQTEWDQEVQIVALAARIREIRAGDHRTEMEEQLRERLEKVFDMKQENRRREIEQLQLELQRLRERMMERNAVRERLIDARLKDLLQ